MSLFYPISALKGYDIYQVAIAFKLLLANELLLISRHNKDDLDEQWSEAIKVYASAWSPIVFQFVEDEKIAELNRLTLTVPVTSVTYMKRVAEIRPRPLDSSGKRLKDERLNELESFESFATFCRHIGANEPLYWGHVYVRIGLKYTSSSPAWNKPVYFK